MQEKVQESGVAAAQLQEAKRNVQGLSAANERLTLKHTRLVKQNQDQTKKIGELNIEIGELNDEIGELNVELNEMVDGAQELEAIKRDLDEIHEKFVEEMRGRKACEKDLQSMRAVCQEQERKLLQLTMQNTQLEMENTKLQDLTLDEIKFRVKLSEKQGQINKLIATARSYEAEITKKDIEYDKTISRMKARAQKDKQRAVQKVKNKLKEAEEKHNELQETLHIEGKTLEKNAHYLAKYIIALVALCDHRPRELELKVAALRNFVTEDLLTKVQKFEELAAQRSPLWTQLKAAYDDTAKYSDAFWTILIKAAQKKPQGSLDFLDL